jgi:hypothetical protein
VPSLEVLLGTSCACMLRRSKAASPGCRYTFHNPPRRVLREQAGIAAAAARERSFPAKLRDAAFEGRVAPGDPRVACTKSRRGAGQAFIISRRLTVHARGPHDARFVAIRTLLLDARVPGT